MRKASNKSSAVTSRSKKSVEKINYDFILTNIDAKFRLVSTANADENVITFKIEKLKTPQQWQIDITDITKHGPSGFPKGAVLKAFKYALEQFIIVEEDEAEPLKGENSVLKTSANSDPYLEAEIEDGGAFLLTLYLPVMGFPVDFSFKLLPVAREQLDVLETALRDAEEEIERLKNELKSKLNPSFVVLRSTTATANTLITWNTVEENVNPSLFVLSANYQEIEVNSAGFYQISVRVSSPDSSATRSIVVRVNGTDRSSAFNGFNTGYSGSVQLSDIIRLSKGDKITTYFTTNNTSNVSALTNQLWIMKIA